MIRANLRVSKKALQKYLSHLYGKDVLVHGFRILGSKKLNAFDDLKGFGYGHPYVIDYFVGDESKQAVLETLRPEGFGHDHFSDRAQILLLQHSSFNKLRCHVRSLDVGAFGTNDECLTSLGKCGEFFIVTEFVNGKPYHRDLDLIKETGQISDLDERRCIALSDYLAEIHRVKREAPWLYVRRARELVGHGECIMGLLDSYPPGLGFAKKSFLIGVERRSVAWRWRLKQRSHRLSQVHGDFHPWNVLFREGIDFTVLDRSRGEWGEPADDVAAMTINYLFYSLQRYERLSGVFERLFKMFWNNYLDKTEDNEILEVIQPFYAWRGLVVASPVWYPKLKKSIRVKLLNLVKNVLHVERFDLDRVNIYF